MEGGRFGAGVIEESSFSSGDTTLSNHSYDQHNVQSSWLCSREKEQSFLQAIDKGMYEMDRNERMGLDTDDDDKLGFSGDEDGGDDTVVAVVDSDVDSLMSNLKDGVICPPDCYWYTGKLAFLCFGPVSKFYSPILSMGGSRNLSTEERKKGSHASIRKIQEEKAVIEHVTGIERGITQQNRMQF